MKNTLLKPSQDLKELIDAERALPKYKGEDEDIDMMEAIQSVLKEKGESVFSPFNHTDQVLLHLAKL